MNYAVGQPTRRKMREIRFRFWDAKKMVEKLAGGEE